MKYSIFNGTVIKTFANITAGILAVFSSIVIFVDFSIVSRWIVLGVLVLVLAVTYIGVWIYCNKKKQVKIKIRNTTIVVKEGDLFNEKDSKMVIPFNEYFDTQVDDVIIAKKSLHGLFITEKAGDLRLFKQNLYKSLKHTSIKYIDQRRSAERMIQYPIGTCVVYNDYILLAYSRFHDDNTAYLHNSDVMEGYLNMWEQIDKIRAGNSISFPVLGTGGFVRFDQDYTPQQLLELMLLSFRVSGKNLARNATLRIIVHRSMMDDIDFLKLKGFSD